MSKVRITQEELKEVLEYNEDTGIFIWKKDLAQGRIKKGSVAGTITEANVRCIGINGTVYKSSTLAWLYIYGEYPKGSIYRLDGDSTNVAKANLSLKKPKKEHKQPI